MKIASDYNNIEYLLQKLSRYWTNNGICILLPSNHSVFSTWWTILILTLQPPGSSPYSKHIRHYIIDTTTTRSSKRTKIAYFTVNLILKETFMVWADRPALVIGIKDSYLMWIFKIGLLEPSEVETDPLITDGQKIAQTDGQKIVQTEGNNLLNIGIWCHTLPTKKFENRTFRTFDDFVFLSVRLYERMDRQKYKI